MKRFVMILFSVAVTAACAGTPPQWWNPSGAYGNESASFAPAAGKTQPTARPVYTEELPVVKEESIATVMPDESYEEMILTPVQDEETEEPAQGEDSSKNTMDITPSAPDTSSTLPAPSVLAE